MKFVLDTDILSMFAKAEALGWLGELLGWENLVMTPAIRDEIAVPLRYGYAFPKEVLSQIVVIPLTERALREYERLWMSYPSLGRGELEAIALCKTTEAIFVTNDRVARKIAQNQGVETISLQTVLRALWVSKIASKAEVRALLERLKIVDHLDVPSEVEREIFSEG